jgi:hypothetical protein
LVKEALEPKDTYFFIGNRRSCDADRKEGYYSAAAYLAKSLPPSVRNHEE